MIKHLGNELDEFIEMYYSPCVADRFGTHQCSTPNGEPHNLMAYSWTILDACAKLSCLANNMRWDRSYDSGGCVPSLIVRATDSGTYDHDGLTNQINCAKDNRVFHCWMTISHADTMKLNCQIIKLQQKYVRVNHAR